MLLLRCIHLNKNYESNKFDSAYLLLREALRLSPLALKVSGS